MKQQSLATAGFELATKRTRKREFLDEMNLVAPSVPMLALIKPHGRNAHQTLRGRLPHENGPAEGPCLSHAPKQAL
jgi:hypothetical protein